MMDCILPIRIEDFRFRIVVRVEMQSKGWHRDNCALLDFNIIISDILVAFSLNPEFKIIFFLLNLEMQLDNCLIANLGTGGCMRSTSWITLSTYGKSRIIS